MVFGLALSVGALALVSNPPTTSTDLYTDIATFGFSFLILILVWFAYTRLMSVFTLEDQWAVVLNTVLLFTVSIEPFLFNVLKSSTISTGFFDVVTQAYAADLGVMMVVLGLFAWELVRSHHPPLAPPLQKGFRTEAVHRWVMAGLFFVSIAPVFNQIDFASEPIRIWIWLVPLVFFTFSRRRRIRLEGSEGLGVGRQAGPGS